MNTKAEKSEGKKRELLILKDTQIDGKRVKRGQVVPYPARNGALLCGASNKAVVLTEDSLAAFEVDEKRRKARKDAISTRAGTPKKPPK